MDYYNNNRRGLIVNKLKNENFKGVLCFQQAMYFNGIYSYCELPLMFFSEIEEEKRYDFDKHLILYGQVPLDYNYTLKVSDNIFVTDKERTVVDMIRYREVVEEEFIYRAVRGYLNENFNRDELLKVAAFYNCSEEVDYICDTCDDWWAEFKGWI